MFGKPDSTLPEPGLVMSVEWVSDARRCTVVVYVGSQEVLDKVSMRSLIAHLGYHLQTEDYIAFVHDDAAKGGPTRKESNNG